MLSRLSLSRARFLKTTHLKNGARLRLMGSSWLIGTGALMRSHTCYILGFPPIRDCTTDLASRTGSPSPTRRCATSAPSSPSRPTRGTASSAAKPISWNISVYSGKKLQRQPIIDIILHIAPLIGHRLLYIPDKFYSEIITISIWM